MIIVVAQTYRWAHVESEIERNICGLYTFMYTLVTILFI